MPQKTDEQLNSESLVVFNEIITNANTANRVGGLLRDINASKINLNAVDTDVSFINNSDLKVPSVKATKAYVDGLVTGLIDDRGNYDASVNTFPNSAGSGIGGTILKGDLYFISVAGTLGGNAVVIGSSIRALVDNPGQTSANWGRLNPGLGFVPENTSNKSINVLTDAASNIKFPSVKAIKDYVDNLISTLNSATPYSYEQLIPTGTNTTTATLLTKFYTDLILSTAANYVKLPINPQLGIVFYVCNTESATNAFIYAGASQFIYQSSENIFSGAGVVTIPPKTLFKLTYTILNTWYLSVESSIEKENTSNKSINVLTDAASNIKFPSVKAIKDYVDQALTTVQNQEKEFSSYLSQSGTTAPVLSGSPIINTMLGSITFEYLNPGGYDIVSSSPNEFTSKTLVYFSYGLNQTGTMGFVFISGTRIRFVCRNAAGTTADNLMQNTLITILVKP